VDATNSPYKIIFFDNDGTLNVNRSTWELLHKHFGTWEPQGREMQEILLRDRTPYDEYSRQITRMWKGIPKERFMEVFRQLPFREGAVELVRELNKRGFILAVLSSGFTLWRDLWHDREKIDWPHYVANEIIFDENGICTGEIDVHVTDNVEGMDKGTWVERIATEEGIDPQKCVFVGDGWGDVPGFKKCGLAIAIDPNMDEVVEAADVVLEGGEIRKVLKMVESTR